MSEEIMEECPRCEGTGVVAAPEALSPLGFIALCPACHGACYVPHICPQGEE